ncbi:MAG: hypothetical protein CMG64_06710 [Candidatus Marinimicrobia bacterium]|nr:hypothetical protein [Candidatus Neomarinimicrobiota bacterium]
MIQDLTSDLPIKPQVDIEFSVRNIRNENDNQIVTISFYSTIQDTDSFIFSYNWDFGDGNSSIEANPNHDFIIVDNHEYRVMLTVEDETGQQGWSSTTIQIDEGPSSFPIKMNFVGDIMMGRRYEEENGIIQIEGINALFEPTRTLLGMNADITVANLEVPLSNQGYEHPSKGIVFRSSPDNISGLTFAGIDVVSLANNHILDYMEAAMIQTQDILDEAGIMHSGAGMNSYEAYLPTFKSIKGQTIAFLASSDRTGQYNNYQPYLHAGENKSGFAYMTPYYIKQQINSVENIADLVVIEMHAGSEYSYSPGDNYDYASYLIPEGYENLKENPASELGFKMIPKNGLEIEDYSWRLDRPQMWDRAIRHFAIDEGADIVIVHHPHIIQGIELYNGKIIAHSLGNFIFDLNYPETYPSMILNSHADESGFTEFYIDPVYIDDYIPVPAKGELGNYILDYIGMRSKELETYIHVDTDNNRAHVIMDSSIMLSQSISYNALALNYKPVINNEVAYLQTEPMSIPKAGSLSKILTGSPYIVYYRLGKEKVWMKNFEDEGSTLWNLNSDSEMLQDSVFRRGKAGLMHIRSYNSPGNIITNLEERIPFNNQYIHTLHGFIKTKNAKNVTLEIRCSTGRTNQSLFTEAINDTISETTNWKKYWDDIPYHEEAEFFDIRINSDIPDSGVAYSWFDDVGLIQWDSLQSILEYPISISYPNDYDYIQFLFHESQTDTIGLELQNTIIGDFGPLIPYPKVVQRVKTIPNTFYFFDESKGPAGEKIWSFNSEIFGFGETAVLNIDSPGIYEITLTVMGLNNQEATQTITVFGLGSNDEEHMVGDLNNDGIITIVDILLCANYVIEIFEPSTQEFIAADIDKNGTIDIFDILLITDLIN